MSTSPQEAELRRAVTEWLDANPDALEPGEARRLRGAQAFRDGDGDLRLGGWLLDERADPPELVRRVRGEGAVVERVLGLARDDPGGWRVVELTERRHRPRRP